MNEQTVTYQEQRGQEEPMLATSASLLLGHVTGRRAPASLAGGGPLFEFQPMDADRRDVLLACGPCSLPCACPALFLPSTD